MVIRQPGGKQRKKIVFVAFHKCQVVGSLTKTAYWVPGEVTGACVMPKTLLAGVMPGPALQRLGGLSCSTCMLWSTDCSCQRAAGLSPPVM